MRGESRRGRGKGRGGASYRGRKPNGPITSLTAGGIPAPSETNGGVPTQQPPSRPSPQPPSGVAQPMPVQQQPMTPMPFYADPNRFPTPVWQTDPSQVSGWQGQFIQQIPTASQPIDTYQQYPNGIYQTTYQQPAFESNAFYAGAVQVLTPTNTRPPSASNQQPQMIPQRPNSSYAHTPSPGPVVQQAQQQTQQQQAQQQQTQQQQNNNRQYQEYNQFGSTVSNEGTQSRPSSVNSVINQNPTTPNANYNQGGQQQNQTQQQTVYTTVSTANFSPSSNQQQTQFVNANSGNGQPGYPQVNTSSPQVVSHNSSGYSGNEQFSGHQNQSQWQQQDHQQMMWEQQQQQQHVQENKMDQQTYQQQTEQQNNHQYITQQQKDHSDNSSPVKVQSDNIQRTFSQADKVNLNTRIKTMILNKQQSDVKIEQDVKNVEQNNPTGHFLWYSHHHHLKPLGVDGGPPRNNLPNRDNNSLINNLLDNTQTFAQNSFRPTHIIVQKKHNELPLRMQRPLHHNHMNNNSNLRKGEALCNNAQKTHHENLIPKTEPPDDIKYDNLEPKLKLLYHRESNIYKVDEHCLQAKSDAKNKFHSNSQFQLGSIKKEVNYANSAEDLFVKNKIDINEPQSAVRVFNCLGSSQALDLKQKPDNQFECNTTNQDSSSVEYYPKSTQDIYFDKRNKQLASISDVSMRSSPGLVSPYPNFRNLHGSKYLFNTLSPLQQINRTSQQNKTPQSPSVSSIKFPQVTNSEQIPTSSFNENNLVCSITPRIQNTGNKTTLPVSSSVGYMMLRASPLDKSSEELQKYSYSPVSSNDTEKYFTAPQISTLSHSGANTKTPQSSMPSPINYPKMPSVENRIPTQNSGSPPSSFYFKTSNCPSPQSSNFASVKSGATNTNSEPCTHSGGPSFLQEKISTPCRNDNKMLHSTVITSPISSSNTNEYQGNVQQLENQKFTHKVDILNSNKEKNKYSPENFSKDRFCSSSNEHIKFRLTNKSDRSPSKLTGEEIPQCHCFPPDQSPPEPGTYYTHLGCADNLRNLRHNLECQTGLNGPAIRIEKVRYTGKEGKTAQGCPIVKWVHRRTNLEEKYLVIVKHRTGHFCQSAFIVVCLVVWEGVSQNNANDLYSLLTYKLNKFGLPTKRRCATNDPRTCACQGINEDNCGASFTFGCSWSMYYNGCKFTRSKDVRKFRLSVKEEEQQIEEKLQNLADHISPLYKAIAPQSFTNQTKFEHVASECRLGTKPGRPFSGVTACMDFCAHAHKDIHNMNDGCTIVVTLTKHRDFLKSDEEQLHVLPLYIPDDTDEFGSREAYELKVEKGEIEILNRYECEVRTFSEPAEKCRNRKGKKEEGQRKRKSATPQPSSPSVSSTSFQSSPKESPLPYNNYEIQSGQVSSTVLDSPIRNPSWGYDNFNSNNNETSYGVHSNGNNFFNYLPQFSVFKTPSTYDNSAFSNHYNQDGYLNNSPNPNNYPKINQFLHPTPNLFSHFSTKHTFPYKISNPFDDMYLNNMPPTPVGSKTTSEVNRKSVEISYTDNSECFSDPAVGGVAIALTHGSILFECAKHEVHATTALKTPDRTNPTRISLVFYQHRSLNKTQHGLDEYTLKQKSKLDFLQPDTIEFDSSFDISRLNSSLENSSREIAIRTATLPTYSMTTMFPMYPCMVTGPYQEHYGGTLKMPNK